ncbi:MAG: hypothetical protein MI867_19960 [Pseudomonadales bacterium]|nr:hypothetical protein [Pseudomonadales bacterium]
MLKHTFFIFFATLISSALIHELLLPHPTEESLEVLQENEANDANHAVIKSKGLKTPSQQQQVSYDELLAEIDSLRASHQKLLEELNHLKTAEIDVREYSAPPSEETLLVMENEYKQSFDDKHIAHFQEEQDENNQAIMEQALSTLETRFTDLNIEGIRIDSTDCNRNTCIVEFIHEIEDTSLNYSLLGLANTKGVSVKKEFIDGIEKTIAIYRLN